MRMNRRIRKLTGPGFVVLGVGAALATLALDQSDVSARPAPMNVVEGVDGPALVQGSPARSLLRPAPPERAAPAGADRLIEHMKSGVVRSRLVEINPGALPDPASPLRTETPVRLDLFDDVSLDIRIDRPGDAHPGAPQVRTMIGHIDGRSHDSWVIISQSDGALYADVIADGSWTMQIRPLGAGLHEVREVDESVLPPCGVGLGGHVNPTREELRRPGDLHRVDEARDAALRGEFQTPVDVLIVYTPAALSTAGSPGNMELSAVSWIETTNLAYTNSGVDHRLRLVGLFETEYVEVGASTDLARLRGQNNGHMDEVHALRNNYGADLVHLISMSTGACGVAYVMPGLTPGFESSGFGLTRFTCGALTFAHEIGHNMGCGHDKENSNFAAFCYSHGFRTSNAAFRSIMAYAPGTRLPYFSSPHIVVNGFVFGVDGDGCPVDAADNVRTMNETSPIVANFRDEVIPTEPSSFSLVAPLIEDGFFTSLTPTLSWTAAENAGHYNIVIATDANLENSVYEPSTTALQFNMPPGVLSFNTVYYWQVTAVNNFGEVTSEEGVAAFRTRHVADFNADGLINSADLAVLLGSWGQCTGACLADITGTGFIGSDDLSILLGSWGAYGD